MGVVERDDEEIYLIYLSSRGALWLGITVSLCTFFLN
jgi:hypothetical protein